MEMHLVFHISLLKLAPNSTLQVLDTNIIIKNIDIEYNIEEILNSKYIKHKLHYLVKWLDYPNMENS